MKPFRIAVVAGARPNFMQIAPIVHALEARKHRAAAEGVAEGKILFVGNVMIDPTGHLEMLYAFRKAALVITDSGGLQEETTVLGIPCITIRENRCRGGRNTLGKSQKRSRPPPLGREDFRPDRGNFPRHRQNPTKTTLPPDDLTDHRVPT